ncbi:LLM class flavin-dependent oxidoreductase [Sulfurimonas sp.]|uniref:LLM class flavin-dependent oxidoreductase n=1 Tax=Sulfurimonas sp. TaxID=2022749 RepID=UPI002B49FD77|nr:LLM class flavin-dependent oxidoreductase [Sulfurimonas sp.]
MKKIKLSVLDQSPVHDGKDDRHGLQDTLELAQLCDELGYHRYMLAEHHNSPGYASSCPEVMVNSVANVTKNIRVGSGGVMLNNHNTFKVAETFNMLCALHGNRIDLGIGRASGANYQTAQALHGNNTQDYSQKAYELIGYLNESLPNEHQFSNLVLTPSNVEVPPVYFLGSSDGSAKLAGILGGGFILALFIGTHDRSNAIINEYKNSFRATNIMKEPKAILAVACIVADTKEKAQYIASTHTYWKLQAFTRYERDDLISPKDLKNIISNLSPSDKKYYDETMDTMILGTAKECKEEITELAKIYDVDEVMIVNVTYSFNDRIKTYTLLAREFNLENS